MKQKEPLIKYFKNKGLYIVQGNDISRLIEVMSESFTGYPLIRHFFGSDDKNSAQAFMKVCLKALGNNCITIADSEQINSALCLYGSEMGEPSLFELIKYGVVFLKNPGIKQTIIMLKYFISMDRIIKKYRSDQDIYIYMFGTHPALQKQGYGSRLMQAVLEYARENSLGVYLETNSAVNCDIYEKFGFKLMETCDIKDENSIKVYALYYF